MIHTIKQNFFDEVQLTSTGDTWHFSSNVAVLSAQDGILEDGSSDNTLIIDAKVMADVTAVQSNGEACTIEIGKSAVLDGRDGIAAQGAHTNISNGGTILADDRGIFAAYNIENSGSIYAAWGILAEGPDLDVANEATGRIVASQVGVALFTIAGQRSSFVNHGHITVADGGMAVEAASGDETIVNDGTIVGNIDLGEGNDLIDVRRGSVKGVIHGGNGDDVLISDNSEVVLNEEAQQGFDAVKSSVSYTLTDNVEQLILTGNGKTTGVGNTLANDVIGSPGENLLKGAAGKDAVIGRKGDDRLIGGLDSDTFWFRRGDGHDVIADFHHGDDQIVITNWIDGFNDLLKDSHVEHGDLVIETAHQSLTLLGVHRSDIDADDFFFGRPI